MEINFHTTAIRLPGPHPRWQLMQAKTRMMPLAMASEALLFEAGRYVDLIRLRAGQRPVLHVFSLLLLSCCLSMSVPAQSQASVNVDRETPKATPHSGVDRSGKARKGKVSYYGREFYRKKMADGTPMNPQSNSAASKTLPLGTTARVTNLKNGNSQVVEIRDRGPYVKDRIVDVSPKTADKLGLKKDGVAPVEVKPMEVPQPDGSVKPGAGAEKKPGDKSPVDPQASRSLH
ncbi:septal ring lytic transglycosylase RlpA family protein [Paraburkholderia fungorum]|uniref:septal ring lytic transglycosylase RlpA family protein n=1 Tax=Paraburkholderia fungorum TaxID=134537 RepID=UPI0038B81303